MQAATKSAQAALDAARQQLSVLNAEIAAARADVAQAKADLETARLKSGLHRDLLADRRLRRQPGRQVGAYDGPMAHIS